MNVNDAVRSRRARRAISSVPLEVREVESLVEAMRLAPSCFNRQPLRAVIVDDEEGLRSVKSALPSGNVWASPAPLIMAICSRDDLDCRLSDERVYNLFDCGLAVGEMLLAATEMGIVAHPIAGYDPFLVKKVLDIPEDHTLISLVICARPGTDRSLLSDKQNADEDRRPERVPVGENFHHGRWGAPWHGSGSP